MPSKSTKKVHKFVLNDANKDQVFAAISAIGRRLNDSKKVEDVEVREKSVEMDDADIEEVLNALDKTGGEDDFPDNFVELAGGASTDVASRISEQVSAKVNRYLKTMLPTLPEDEELDEEKEDAVDVLDCQFDRLLRDYRDEQVDEEVSCDEFNRSKIDYSELFAGFDNREKETTKAEIGVIEQVASVPAKAQMVKPEISVRRRDLDSEFRLSTTECGGLRRIVLNTNKDKTAEKESDEEELPSRRISNHSLERMKQRRKDETAEERRERKKAWKEMRAENRKMKKETKVAFKLRAAAQ